MPDKLAQMNSVTGARALADTAYELNRVHFTSRVPKSFNSSETEINNAETSKVSGARPSNPAFAKMSAEAAIGPISIAKQNYSLNRMRDLAVQAASEKYDRSEQIFMMKEYQQLKAEIDRINKETDDKAKVGKAIQQYQTVQSMPSMDDSIDISFKMTG